MKFQNTFLAIFTLAASTSVSAADWNLSFNAQLPPGFTYKIVLDDTVLPTSVITEGTVVNSTTFGSTTYADLYFDSQYNYNKSVFKEFYISYDGFTFTLDHLDNNVRLNGLVENGSASSIELGASYSIGTTNYLMRYLFPYPTDGNSEISTPNGITYYSHIPKVGIGGTYFVEYLNGNLGRSSSFGLSSITLAPVPEPETYALLLAGLGVMGAAGRRRRTS